MTKQIGSKKMPIFQRMVLAASLFMAPAAQAQTRQFQALLESRNIAPPTEAKAGVEGGGHVSAPQIMVGPPAWRTGLAVAWGRNESGESTAPDEARDVALVAAGFDHTLALRRDGRVVAWGGNAHGQTTVPSGLADVTSIAAGFFHSLAMDGAGKVFAWGKNEAGQCDVPSGLVATSISAGQYHSVALNLNGQAIVWGSNEYGQADVPPGLGSARAIAAGGAHTVALLGDGAVAAWGNNGLGQLDVPAGLNDVVAVAAGNAHNLALRSDGTVVAWGWNASGQCNVPSGLAGVTAISAGLAHSMALRSDGVLVAWGGDEFGQSTPPEGVVGVLAVSAGVYHSAAIVAPPPQVPFVADITRPGDLIVPVGGNSPAAEQAAMAIDDLPETKYLNFVKLNSGFVVTPSLRNTVVTGLTLTSANDYDGRDPRSFQLAGSDNGLNFELIAEQSVPLFTARFQKQSFSFPNGKRYGSYRLLFPSIRDPDQVGEVQIAEVELLGRAVPNSIPLERLYTNGIPILATNSIALEGNGDGPKVVVANGPNLAGQSFTIEAWIRTYDDYRNDYFLFQGEPQLRKGLHLGMNAGGNFRFGFWDDNLDAGGPFTSRLWHHWACTFDAVSRRRTIFRDGVAIASDIAGGSYGGSGEMVVGGVPPLGWKFRGQIDELRVWSRVLPGAEIAARMGEPLLGNEAGLDAYYRFDEGDGALARDGSGHGRDGLLRDSANWMHSGAFPAFRPSGEWRELKVLWPLRLDAAVNPIYQNGASYLQGSGNYVALATLKDYLNGHTVNYQGDPGGHNGVDVGAIGGYRLVNNNALQVVAMAGGVLQAKRDGLDDHAGGHDIHQEGQKAATGVWLAGRWRLNEGSGSNVADESTNHVAGAIVGSGWSWQNDPARGQVLNLTGGAFVRIPAPLVNLRKNGFTVAAWIKTGQLGAPLMSRGDGDGIWEDGEHQLYLSGRGTLNDDPNGALSLIGWGTWYSTGRKSVADSQWHHVAFVMDPYNGRSQVYVDGQPDRMTRSHFSLDLGRNDNPGAMTMLGFKEADEASGHFVGLLSDVAVFHGALSPGEIASVMNGGGVAPQAPRDLFAIWPQATPNRNVRGYDDGSGNCVYLMHPNGFFSQYAHLKKDSINPAFKVGDWVPAGAVLGVMGSSGASSGPHIHFGLHLGHEALQLRPELFHPTERTNAGLTRFGRGNGFVEAFFEEPGTGETMWKEGEAVPPYEFWERGYLDIYDIIVGVAPIWLNNPPDNPQTVPLNTPIYVAPLILDGQGSWKLELKMPDQSVVPLDPRDGQSPAFKTMVAGDHSILAWRRLRDADPWEARGSMPIKVLPPLVRTILEADVNPAMSGTVQSDGAVAGGVLSAGDTAQKSQREAILTFGPEGLPPNAQIFYAELRLPLEGNEGISPWDRGAGWGGQLFAETKGPNFGGSPLLQPEDWADPAEIAAQMSRAVYPGDVSIGVLRPGALGKIGRGAPTQFRLRFEVHSNQDAHADALHFSNTEARRAQLVVYHGGPGPVAGEDLELGSATLRALTPLGPAETAWIEWGPAGSFFGNKSAPVRSDVAGQVEFSIPLAGLIPGADYSYRVARGSGAGVYYSEVRTFRPRPPGAGLAGRFAGDANIAGPAIPLAAGSFTIEAWARRANVSGERMLVSQGDWGVDQRVSVGFLSGAQAFFGFGGDDLVANVPADTAWHHWAFTYDSASRRRRMFRDGVQIAADASRGVPLASGQIFIGSQLLQNAFFEGDMDEVRIWRRALGQQEIAANMNRSLTGGEEGLAALYTFDADEDADTLHDASPSGNDAPFLNTIRFAASGAKLAESVILKLQPGAGGNGVLHFMGNSNLTYRVFGTADFANWLPLGAGEAAAPGNFQLSVPMTAPGAPKAFYQIRYP